MENSMNRNILRLAIPNIISNITVPLLSMVDMSIVGHLSLDIYIGAIVTATLIFNFIYWSFSFLRMGTSGFTAQAYGAEDNQKSVTILFRALLIALVAGVCIIVFQKFIFNFAFYVLQASEEIKFYAYKYFNIYVWVAPVVLGMYVFSGWFVGMQDARTPMYIAITINIVNISLSLFFVFILKMNIEGVALGSTIAQVLGFIMAFLIWFFKYKTTGFHIDFKCLLDLKAYFPFFRVNTDIFIRTMLLISVTTFFTSVSAKMGDTILAANALLMQLFILFSYMMDGFAYAAEALTGRFVGARKINLLEQMIKALFKWGLGLVILFTVVYGLFTEQILGLLTDKEDVIAVCRKYQFWALLMPVAGFSAFLWDGIFIGATASRQMRNSMFIAAASFFSIYYLLYTLWGNHALWFAFIIYLAMRGIIQVFLFRNIRTKLV